MKPMTIRNMGKYDATFKFFVKSDLVRDLVTIAPEEGMLQPGKEVMVEVSTGNGGLCNTMVDVDSQTASHQLATVCPRAQTAWWCLPKLQYTQTCQHAKHQ